MAYLGVSPSNGVRKVHTYTATSSQTTFSGAGAENISLSYRDSTYIDVYQNGVKLGDADYTATSGTSVVLGTGASASDIVVVVVYDVFSVADTVSKTDGGQFDGDVTFAGAFTSQGIDDNADAVALTIDSDERVLIGKTSSNLSTAGSEFASDGLVRFTRSNVNAVVNFNKKDNTGDIVSFRKDDASVGSVGYVATGQYIQGETDHSGIRFGGNQLIPFRNGADTDATTDLGATSVRYRNLYLSGGAFIGGTGSANQLDDYEEGTFTPGLIDSADGLGANLTTQVGQYTKVGNLVTFSIRLNGDARTSTGNQVLISGLPFTFSPTSTVNRIMFEVNGINLNLDSNFFSLIGQLANNDTNLTILMQGTSLDNFRGHDLTPSYEIYVHGSYFA